MASVYDFVLLEAKLEGDPAAKTEITHDEEERHERREHRSRFGQHWRPSTLSQALFNASATIMAILATLGIICIISDHFSTRSGSRGAG